MRNFPHDPRHQELIKQLRKLRKDAEVLQGDLATLLDRPQSYVSKYETGERRLDFVDVYLICQALNVDFPTFAKSFQKAVRNS